MRFLRKNRVRGVGLPGACTRARGFLCLAARMRRVELAAPYSFRAVRAKPADDFDVDFDLIQLRRIGRYYRSTIVLRQLTNNVVPGCWMLRGAFSVGTVSAGG